MNNKVGLGTFPLAGVFNPISSSEAEKLVKQFIDLGGFYIDTAPLYGNGEIEKLLGNTLKDVPRNKYYFCTKTVKHVDKQGKLFKSGKYKDVFEQIDNSLTRLKMDYVDLLMVHQTDDNVPIDETLKALEDLQKTGKVKELAVSNVNLDELKEYNQTGKIKYVQNRFSLINRSLSSDFKKYLIENQIYLMPYHLLEIGLLTGIAFEDFKLREGDLRKNLPYWDSKNQEVIFKWVRDELSPISKKLGITTGQLNQAWALHQPFVDFIVVGTTKVEYLEINLKSNLIKLDKESLDEIEEAYKKLEKQILTDFHQTVREFRGLNEKFY